MVSKWEEVKEKLTLIEAWARDGLIEAQIAHNLDIGVSTLSKYKTEHIELVEALKKGKEVVDIEVENALLKKAKGFIVKVNKVFKCKTVTYKDGKRLKEVEELKTAEEDVYIPPDTTAAIFWLKNRKPKEWRDVKEFDGDIKIALAGEVEEYSK